MLGKIPVLISIPTGFLKQLGFILFFCTAKSLSVFDISLSNLFCHLQPVCFIYNHQMHLIAIKMRCKTLKSSQGKIKPFIQSCMKRCHLYSRLSSWSSNCRLPSSVHVNIVWHLQWCWSPACTCCSAVGPLPSGFYFSGNGNRAKRPSVINNNIYAAQNTTCLSAAIF